MTTRPLSEDEWELYREIRLRALADTPSAFGSTLERERGFTEADWRQRMRGPMVVVEEEGDPVAIGATFEDADGVTCVWGMWTEPTSRGRGHATAILHALLDNAIAAGRPVELDVNIVNVPAIAAYERFGFVATGRTQPLREGSDMLVQRMVFAGLPG